MNDRDEEVSARLRSMVHPFILRRLKKDVLTELPDKIEKTVTIELEGEQRKLYDAYAKRLKLYLEKQSKEEFKTEQAGSIEGTHKTAPALLRSGVISGKLSR